MTKPFLGFVAFPASYLATMQSYAVQLGNGGEAERLNFQQKLCLASDPKTVVAYGGGTGPIDQATIDFIETHIIPSMPAGSFWMRCENMEYPYKVLKTNHAPTQAQIDAGQDVLYDEAKILSAIGLAKLPPEPM